jgi:class 3 adenylate cyclase/tetratricopeptide (TPR) repeat protein
MSAADNIKTAIAALEGQRALLGDAAVDAAVATLRAQLATVEVEQDKALQLTGERKLVTVMFADISGFTALSEKLDPEEVRALMNRCFDSLVPVVQKFNGTIDKFIGDEIMALFGAPAALERHAELACAAALELMKTLEVFNAQHNTALGLHIGINSGLVIAGGIGSQGRQDYSVMGDAVNLAARLKDAASGGEVFVGEEVFALVKDFFYLNALPPMRMKGKQELVRCWKLLQGKERSELRKEKAIQSELIGRKEELDTIFKTVAELENGKSATICLIGEAGIGKSRLLEEVNSRLGPRVCWAAGFSMPTHRQHAYHPVIEVIERLLAPGQPFDAARIRYKLEQLFPAADSPENSTHLAVLGHIMQLPLSETEEIRIQYLKGNELRQKIAGAFAELLTKVSAEKPLVLVLDDLQWADPSTLNLLEDLIEQENKALYLLFLVFRPQREERIWELQQKWAGQSGEGFQQIFLEPLESGYSISLARKLLHVEQIAPEVEQLLLEKAEGNPFFLEELLRALLDSELLYIEGKKLFSTDKLDAITIPRTLQGVIASRIDALVASDKQVLQISSVLGRMFRDIALAELLLSVKKQLTPHPALQRLVERELLRIETEELATLSAYMFKHAVTHDVAYSTLLQADRKILHQLAGETLERLFRDQKDEHAERIAYHFEKAGLAEKALDYLEIAAELAKENHFNEEAIALYNRGLAQLRQLAEMPGSKPVWREKICTFLENQGDIFRITAQTEPALAAYASALEQLSDENAVGRARLFRKTGMCYQGLSRVMDMVFHLQTAQDALEKWHGEKTQEWGEEWIEVLSERMMLHYWTNETDTMQDFAGKIEPVLERHGSPSQRAKFYNNLVALHLRLESYLLSEIPLRYATQAVSAASETNDLQVQAAAGFVMGFSCLWKNEMESGIPHFQYSYDLAERTGDLVTQSRNLTYLAISWRRIGDRERTMEYVDKSLDISHKIGMLEYLGMANANLAWLAVHDGRWTDVEAFVLKAYGYWNQLAVKGSSQVFVWLAVFPMVEALSSKKDFKACKSELEKLLLPGRKRLEPEFEESIRAYCAIAEDGEITEKSVSLTKVQALARHFKYV